MRHMHAVLRRVCKCSKFQASCAAKTPVALHQPRRSQSLTCGPRRLTVLHNGTGRWRLAARRMQTDAAGGSGGGIVQAADSQHPFTAGSPATLDASQPLLQDMPASRLSDVCSPLTVANQSPVVLGSSLQPWRRRINSSIMKRIINMTRESLSHDC